MHKLRLASVRVLTPHRARGALRVARALDGKITPTSAAEHTYAHLATLGELPAVDLREAADFLIERGLLRRVDGFLHPSPALIMIAEMREDDALLALGYAFGLDSASARRLALGMYDSEEVLVPDPTMEARAAIGAAGEEKVVEECKKQLVNLGALEEASQVRRVSVLSDAFGYDVCAPRLSGDGRMIEVKTQSGKISDIFRFYLTRHEFDTGLASENWALVACSYDGLVPTGVASVYGWCRPRALRAYLPEDRLGRWTEALVTLPVAVLSPGIPPAA